MDTIYFNQPYRVAMESIVPILSNMEKFSGDGPITKKCHDWFRERLGSDVLLTTSCTHSLEIMALLIDVQPGDEIIMPSFTFVSTANAFVMRGAKIVFVDIRPDTMNIDETLIEAAINEKTKAIMVVHYAGVSCEMTKIKKIADRHSLYLLEDAAQGMMSTYFDRPLGTIGHLGAYSFHETKNYHCGEGGLLIINDPALLKNAEIIREKGTNRSAFWRGEVDKYTWQMIGSSYLLGELNAAYLYPQLELAEQINQTRLARWYTYNSDLQDLANKEIVELPVIPDGCVHNAHMYYLKTKNLEQRTKLISYLKSKAINAIFHYVPLHSSPAGLRYGKFFAEDIYTTVESERLLRLPMFYDLKESDCHKVIEEIYQFFK
jgi:dTDP-4-amino-4,6-dideoxygalactose transaminase